MFEEKFKNEEIIILTKKRCRELLKEPQNKDLNINSFTIGFLYGLIEGRRSG
jgi:hypothetical protein